MLTADDIDFIVLDIDETFTRWAGVHRFDRRVAYVSASAMQFWNYYARKHTRKTIRIAPI